MINVCVALLNQEPDSPPEVIHWYEVNNQTPSGAISLLSGNPKRVSIEFSAHMILCDFMSYSFFFFFGSFILFPRFHQREQSKTMSPSWRCSQAGEWTRTVGCISGRILLNMNSSGDPWWVCENHVPAAALDERENSHNWVLSSNPQRTSSQITWFHYRVRRMGWWIILSCCRYLLFVLTVHSLSFQEVALLLETCCSCPSTEKYVSPRYRLFSTPAPVRRYTGTFTPKSRAGNLGGSFSLCCGGRAFISPIRELPRLEKPSDFSNEHTHIQYDTYAHRFVFVSFPN